MSDAGQVLSTANYQGTDRRTEPERAVGDRLEQMYAVWKPIFDGMHSVEMSHAPLAGEDDTPLERRMEQAWNSQNDALRNFHRAPASEVSAASRHQGLSNPARTASAARIGPASSQLGTARPQWSRAQASTVPVTRAVVEIDEVTENFSASRPERSGQEAFRPVAADTINVFIRGEVVRVVVRDRAVSEEEALRVAFATARHLMGRSTALAQLTLNGQVLYDQRASDPDRSAALMFV